MSHKVSGVVDNVFSKAKVSKAGKNFTIWYCTVGDVTFSTGFKKVFEQGEMINVEVENKYNEWQYVGQANNPALPMAGSAPVPKTGGGSRSNVTSFTGGGNKGKFPIDPKDGQMSIIRQSSMNRAVEIMDQLIKTDTIRFKNKDEYMDHLINIALEITDFSSGADITKIMELAQVKAQAKEVYNA